MIFEPSFCLILTYTRANGPDPDTDVVVDMQAIWDYQLLKGSATSMDWPQGTAIVPYVNSYEFFPGGNNLLTDSVSDKYGIKRWSIESFSRIPGKLQIAYYLWSNWDNSAPDSTADFTFDTGSWDTGDLFVFTGTYDDPYYRAPRFRFIPGWLVGPLGV